MQLRAVSSQDPAQKMAHHVVGFLLAPGRHAVVGMSVAKAAAFHNKIIDGIVVRGEDSTTRMFGLAGTLLALQQTDAQVGDHELVLGGGSIRIHRVPGRQSSIDHLKFGVEEKKKGLK